MADIQPKKPKPIEGKHYDVYLGDSFFNEHGSSSQLFHTLRYQFIPQSVKNFTESGTIQINEREVLVELPGENGEGKVFHGQREVLNEGNSHLECVLIFDGNSFRIERLTSNIKTLKPRRGSIKGAKKTKRTLPGYNSTSSAGQQSGSTSAATSRQCATCHNSASSPSMYECYSCRNFYHTVCAAETSAPVPGTSWVCPSCKTGRSAADGMNGTQPHGGYDFLQDHSRKRTSFEANLPQNTHSPQKMTNQLNRGYNHNLGPAISNGVGLGAHTENPAGSMHPSMMHTGLTNGSQLQTYPIGPGPIGLDGRPVSAINEDSDSGSDDSSDDSSDDDDLRHFIR